MNDEWLDVPGRYRGAYQVNPTARLVRSLDRLVTGPRGRVRFAQGRVLVPHRVPKGGWYCSLWHEGKPRTLNINRIRRCALEGIEP
jgi:hypothetical protein